MGMVAARIGGLIGGIALMVGVAARAAEPVAAPVPAALPASSAVLMVDVPAGAVDAEAALRRRVNTHVETLRSEHHLRRVILPAASPTRKTAWYKSTEVTFERVAWLRDHLRVAAVPGTPLIEVSLMDVADPADRREILMDVCTKYMEGLRTYERERTSDRVQVLTGTKIKAEIRLRDLLGEAREKQIRLAADGGGVNGRAGATEQELSRAVEERARLRAEVDRWTMEVDAMAEAAKGGKEAAGVDAVVEADARVGQLRGLAEDAGLRADLAKARAGEKDPAAATARAEADVYKRHLDARRAEVRARALADARAKLAVAKSVLESNESRVKGLKADLGELSTTAAAYQAMEEERKLMVEQSQTARRQIDDIMAAQAMVDEVAGVRWHLTPEVARAPR